MTTLTKGLPKDENGATAIETRRIAAFIAVANVGAVSGPEAASAVSSTTFMPACNAEAGQLRSSCR
jgi:Flp pilus assembly pilin Flp